MLWVLILLDLLHKLADAAQVSAPLQLVTRRWAGCASAFVCWWLGVGL